PDHGNFHGPGCGKCFRIVDGELVEQRVRIHAAKSFGEPHVLACSPESGPVGEISGLDDERVAVPVAARITFQLTDALWKWRTVIQWNDADVMDHFYENSHISCALHNLNIVIVSSRKH